ncbi:membrane metallo-endopeptidase-like 1, partial [Trichogramma pretiosum]|uniref:membrane metallo-endopeptidase-like 1 n=1 Tax=Trichogramma pretiosum TaxID=7493 RepID=UPI000C719AB6
SKKSFFKKHRRILPLLFVVLPFTALTMACLTLGAMYAKFSKPVVLCDNEECVRMASSLKESMNTSVDPCDDFHKYVCGRWPESHPIPDGDRSQNWLSERQTRILRRIPDLMAQNFTERRPEVPRAVKEAQILYFSCLDVQAQYKLGLEPLFDLLAELGLPRVPRQIISGQDDGSEDFVKQMARVKRLLWSDMFFGLEVHADPRDNRQKLLLLDLPDRAHTPFPRDRSVLEEDDLTRDSKSSNETVSAMEKLYLVELLKHVVGNGTSDSLYSCKSPEKFDNATIAKMTDLVDQVVNFAGVTNKINSRYANKSSDFSDKPEEVDDANYMLLDELQRLTDDYVRSVNKSIVPRPLWRPFVEELLRGLEIDFDLTQHKVYVGDLEFLQEIALVLSSTDEQLLETMVWLRVVVHCVQHTSWGLRRISNILKDETGLGQRKARSIHCSESVKELMGMAVAWLFAEPTFSPDHVAEMLENIKRSFVDFVLKDIDWMDEATKLATLEKIHKMKSLIGFPDWLFEDGRLDEYYGGINITKDTYFDNMLQIIRAKNIKTLMNLSKNDTHDNWFMDPITVNALALITTNLIEIPVGILRFPFYGLGLEALNYGAMGSVLGHETTHGFDVEGRHFDSAGNLKQWWSNETIARYTTKATCFVEQYDDYYLPEIDKYVNGKLTLSENIADNGGLRQAYEAYRIWKSKHGDEPLLTGFGNFTHEQLFFLSYAHMWCDSLTDDGLLIWISQHSHCPGRVRLQQVLRNSEHFSRAFSCPVGSPMNPKKKCQLW